MSTEPETRIPFPRTDTPLACQAHPDWFAHEQTSVPAARQDIARAKRACSGCPIAAGCLKWALANPGPSRIGVWASTTPRERSALRRRLRARLGPDWIGVVAQADRERARRTAYPPLPEPSPMWSQPYRPWHEPLTPEQQRRNRELLDLAQRRPRTSRSEQTLGKAS
ncbi:WhiB family transcriptional regulator [Streptomyces sp. NWU49]|uniref:WhiB family transcriptional regulator n=1 Tax=Streptomyces sp. NWU49 TaxID=2201153 RepID=UPI000D672B71|nr:WhiB family transcriptional regulator [Streptomyces sp. NWU49]PWJ02168.1 WhiB family transcriptional regulator [Streptomyces sp. NWU49]